MQAHVLAQRHTQFERGAVGLGAVRQIDVGEVLIEEKINAAGQPLVEQIRLDEAELGAAGVFAVGHRRAGEPAGAHEVALRHRYLRHPAVRGRIAAHHREVAGRLLLDVDIDDDAVRRRARLVGDLHILEVVEILDAPLGAVDQSAVVGVAFGNVELAPDHIVAGAGVAADVDTLDIGAHALVDDIDDADGVVLRVAVAARLHGGERIAVLGDLDREVLDRFLHRFAVVDGAGARAQHRTQRPPVDSANVGLHVDDAEMVLRAFLDGEGDDEALFGRIVFAGRRDDLHVGEAVLEVEAANQIAVGLDAVGVVDVGGLQKAEKVRLRGLDDVLQAV